jgi:hypothetical protein
MPVGAWFGGPEFKKRLLAFKRNIGREIGRAIYQETSIELKEVKRRTPVDKGALRASEHVEGPLRTGPNDSIIYALIVAGGPAAPYAIYVHEDLEAIHPVGEAKFIESVLLESRPFMAARIAKRIDLNRAIS